jgi:RNA polymerase sigma-70 factor, ECF subfamily
MTLAFTRTASAPANFQPECGEASTDEMLIARIAEHDSLAMRTLFARHQTRVYRFLLRLVRNEAIAEDIVSDVFLEIWRAASRFEARAPVSTWILAIARFKALSVMRRRVDEELDEDMADTIADSSDDPEVALQHKHDAERIQQSLYQLSPAHAEVIDLVYYHGKSIKEVAEIVGMPEATVKTRMFYARKKLGGLLRDCVSDSLH